MAFNSQHSLSIIQTIALPPRPAVQLGAAPAPAPSQPVFDAAQAQALVVGSDVVSFEAGVPADFRQMIADSALLAQFAASGITPAEQDPIGWFDAYSGALANFGWVTQARETSAYSFKGDGLEVHEAIIQVVTAFLGAAPAAVQLVLTTLNALKSMNKDSPLITLFDRESQHADVGRFQVTLVSQDPAKGLLVEAMAFALSADRAITQILFFKLHKDRTSLRTSHGTLSINSEAMAAVAPAIKAKIAAYRATYIGAIPLPPIAAP